MVDRNLNRLVQTPQNLRRWQYGPRPVTAVQVREAVAAGGLVTISDVAPADPQAGQLWFDSVNSRLYLYYADPTSAQWIGV